MSYFPPCITQTFSCQPAMPWWRHQMETFSTLLAIYGNSPVIGEFPSQRPVKVSFDVFFDLCLNKRLNKQSWGWWVEMLLCPLWRHYNGPPVSEDHNSPSSLTSTSAVVLQSAFCCDIQCQQHGPQSATQSSTWPAAVAVPENGYKWATYSLK